MYSNGIQVELLVKLEKSKNSTIQAILKELRKFNTLREDDVEFAIISARKSLDYMIRSSSGLAEIKAGTKPLDGLIDELLKVKFLPSVIHKHCKIIKEFGNIAAHGISADFSDIESSELSDIEASICSYSLNAVVSWYASKVLPKVLDIFPFKIVTGKEITEEQIAEAIEIDNNVYSEGFRGIYQVCIEWYRKNPDIYRFIIDQNINKVVGYINAMPVEEKIFQAIESGSLMDMDIRASDIRTYDLPDIYKLYLCSVAISHSYRGTVAFKMLYEAFFDRLLELAHHDVYISEIVADAVTEEGIKLCEFLGMKQVQVSNHDSSIYKVSLLPPSIRVTTDKAKIFQTLYKRKYEELKDLLDINQHI